MVDEQIVLAHGGGGKLTQELLQNCILPALGSGGSALPDAAPVPGVDGLVLTTDSFVVKPLFFRGGDIGSLSVHGTVNDLAVSGARPLALSLGLILEEGLSLDLLQRVVASAAAAARASGVAIVTGDTKVVSRGEVDQVFVNTAGVGQRVREMNAAQIVPGDRLLLSGPIADHGIAVLSEREGIRFETEVVSDSAPVWPYVDALLQAGIDVHVMRDPTRGGLAAACVELATDAAVTVELQEAQIPVRREVRAACEMLGLDPLTVANEGKLLAFVAETDAERALACVREVPGGEQASLVGTVVAQERLPAVMVTRYGGRRVVELPYGEELPRIC